MQSRSTASRRVNAIAVAALLCLFAGHFFAVYERRHRALDHDEAQYLHVGWLMAQGERLYRDFAEDHSPFLFVIFKLLVPAGGTEAMPRLDVLSYAASARTVTAACGVLALVCVALLTYRATRSVLAPLVTITALLGSDWFWYRALADARNDPPALLLFWLGALLLIGSWQKERSRYLLAGIGIGLAVAAALWNPKMPFECIILGALYLWRLKEAFRSGVRAVAMTVLPAVAITAAALFFVLRTASLSDYFFFTFQYNLIFTSSTGSSSGFLRRFIYCDPVFKGLLPLLALSAASAVLLVPRLRVRIRDLDLRAYAIVLALAFAAFLDIQFVFPYPNLWPQYYLMWDIAVAALYGMTAAAVLRSIANARFELAGQVIAAVLAVVVVQQTLLWSGGPPSWHAVSYLQQRLRPQETVWLSSAVHPIAARDASYYWFAFADLMPVSLQYAASHPGQSPLPVVRQEDLPICRAERGLEPNLRFVSGVATLGSLPVARECLERMIAAGRAKRAPIRDIWDLR
jgi:hypothetical protein